MSTLNNNSITCSSGDFSINVPDTNKIYLNSNNGYLSTGIITTNGKQIYCGPLNCGNILINSGNTYNTIQDNYTTLNLGTTTQPFGGQIGTFKIDGVSNNPPTSFTIGSGNVYGFSASGTLTYTSGLGFVVSSGASSISIKENVTPLSEDRYNMNNFLQIKPILYNFINDASKERKVGFIAENFHELNFNELVYYDDKDDKNKPTGINYLFITPFIVKIVQEQQQQIESQQSQINALKDEIQSLKDLITSSLQK